MWTKSMTVFSYPQASITNASKFCSSDWLWTIWYLFIGCLDFAFENGGVKTLYHPLDSSWGQHFDILESLPCLALCLDVRRVVEWVWLLPAAKDVQDTRCVKLLLRKMVGKHHVCRGPLNIKTVIKNEFKPSDQIVLVITLS